MSDIDVPIAGRGVVADEWFERMERVPMSKAPTRSLVLSLLAPLDGARILEVGSGTGAMTVEFMRAAGETGSVTSIESSPLAAGIAARNVERCGLACKAQLVTGKAPKRIPTDTYHTIFIGGHGGDIEAIIGTCWGMLELGGRLLVTAVTPQTTSRALQYLEGLGVAPGFWRVHAAVGKRVGSDWILQGNNPIDLIWGDK